MKNIVVVGGSRIGAYVARYFSEAGYGIGILYHNPSVDLSNTLSIIDSNGGKYLACQCDVADYDQVFESAHKIETGLGKIYGVVNCADFMCATPFPFDDITCENAQMQIYVGIHGAINIFNVFGPRMKKNFDGSIVNILDSSYNQVWPGFSIHGLVKSSVAYLTKVMAVELAPFVRINAVSFGPILQPYNISVEIETKIAKRNLMQNWGSVDQGLAAIDFALNCKFSTGSIINVDGGESINIINQA